MPPSPAYNLAALIQALERLKTQEPDQVTLESVLGRFAPELRSMLKSGWTDESLSDLLAGNNVGSRDDCMLLFKEIRRREREGRKARKQKAKGGDTKPRPGAEKHTGGKPFGLIASRPGGFKKNEGI